MKNINLEFENSFQPTKVKADDKLKKKFNNLILKIKSDLKNSNKTLNVLSKNYKLNFKKSEIKKFYKFKTIAIIGMGGSILGSEAIYEFLEEKIKKKIFFFNNIDEKEILFFKKNNNLSKVLFIIISKSGNTLETLSNSLFLNIFKKNSKNTIIISEKKNNFLYNLSKKYDLFYIEHKPQIGGRFSVLSETGIIPSYLMGADINKLRSDLLDFLYKDKNFFKESIFCLFKYLNSNKYNNLVFLNYSPRLNKFLYWNQQLIAESLGKKGKGFFPVISSAPKDHHSLLQLYLDGPKDKFFYIFSEEIKKSLKIKFNNNLQEKYYQKKNYLSSIKMAQKRALIKSLKINKIPFREIKIKIVNEKTLSKLFSYFILETVVLGELSKINPFNQPSVEQVKIFTKELLS